MTQRKKAEATGKKAYLATLGTYAKGWEIISSKFNEVLDDASKTFDEFAESGEKIESDLKQRVTQNTQLNDKIAQLKAKLGIDTVREEKIEQLVDKVAALTTQVEALVDAQVKQQSAQSQATDKPASTRKRATSTRKTSTQSRKSTSSASTSKSTSNSSAKS